MTRELVQRADEVEAQRGSGPPFFVDVRARREGRAWGFHGDAFERLLGPTRYRWIQGLGNPAMVGKTGSEDYPRITNEESAEELLDLILRCAEERRRVIFFCACEHFEDCHRSDERELLLERAKGRKILLDILEWPGGVDVAGWCSPADARRVPRRWPD